MDHIKEEDIICIVPSSPSSQEMSFSVCYLSHTSPIALSIIHGLPTPQPHLFPYIIQLPHRFPSYLLLPPERIHVILSTQSGAGEAVQIWDPVIKMVLQTTGLNDESYHVLKTESHTTVRKFAEDELRVQAAEGRPQTVLLLSGDGGVVDLLNGVMNGERSSKFLPPTIILFPLGTGNALFHSIHRPPAPVTDGDRNPSTVHDLVLALRTLLFGSARPLPTFRATFSPGSRLLTDEGRSATTIPRNVIYGAIVASYGLHSTLVADSDTAEWRKQGPARFSKVALKLLNPPGGGPPHAYLGRVRLQKPTGPEGLGTNEHGYILLTFVSNLEKTFTISPSSMPLDGQLRLVHFGNETAQEVGRIMSGAYRGGTHVTDPKVRYEAVKSAMIEFWEGERVYDDRPEYEYEMAYKVDEQGMEGRWRRVCVDGLIIRVEKGGWMNVETLPRAEWPLCVVVGTGLQVHES